MKKVLFALVFLGLFFGVSFSQTTLYDGWISFSSSYLGDNEYEYNYKWGASTTLSQEEIDNLFLYETEPYVPGVVYHRGVAGIGTRDAPFLLSWENVVDLIPYSMSVELQPIVVGPDYNKILGFNGVMGGSWSSNRASWIAGTGFSFRTKGNTGIQNIMVNIDYYAIYVLVSGSGPPGYPDLAGTSLEVTGSFTPIPEPTTLILFGSGLLGWAGFTRFKPKNKR